jgi:hypothetical protein
MYYSPMHAFMAQFEEAKGNHGMTRNAWETADVSHTIDACFLVRANMGQKISHENG